MGSVFVVVSAQFLSTMHVKRLNSHGVVFCLDGLCRCQSMHNSVLFESILLGAMSLFEFVRVPVRVGWNSVHQNLNFECPTPTIPPSSLASPPETPGLTFLLISRSLHARFSSQSRLKFDSPSSSSCTFVPTLAPDWRARRPSRLQPKRLGASASECQRRTGGPGRASRREPPRRDVNEMELNFDLKLAMFELGHLQQVH